ncbi:MAG: hypothetical protein AAGB11_04085 [Pseudomonadota bacterium]
MSEAAFRDALQRVLGGSTFARSRRSRELLGYVVERALADPEAVISGPVIAQDVFGRGAGFDASSDPIVRVQMRRVRELLEEYYTNEAPTDPVRITIPKGTYRPVLSLTEAPQDGSHAERLDGHGIDPPVAAPGTRIQETPPAPTLRFTDGAPSELGRARRPWRAYPRSAALALVVLLCALFIYWQVTPTSEPESGYPALAILPFENLTGEPGNDVFATGFQHQFAADLRRFNTVRVGLVSGEVGERYDFVLSGDILSVGDEIDLHMRLTERATGNEIARRRFQSSGSQNNYFEALTAISGSAAAGIAWPGGAAAEEYILKRENSGVRPLASSDAFLCLARFKAFTNSKSKEHFRPAFACLEETTRRHPSDPVLGAAYAWLIALSSPEAHQLDIPELAERSSLEFAEEVALKSVELDPTTDVAHEYLGLIRGAMGKTRGAIDSMQRAHQQNLANPDILANLAYQHAYLGEWEEARQTAQQAMEASLSPPPWYVTPLFFDALVRGDGKAALTFAGRLALGEDPSEPIYMFAAASVAENKAEMERHRENLGAIAARFDGDPLFVVRRWVWSDEIVAALSDALTKGGFTVP